jgi:limonene-1,2-epoxide hydrolase
MHPNAELVKTFYSCFQQQDGKGMASCYHDNIQFSDPVFPDLRGSAAGAMWKMLCSQAKGFELSFRDIQADDTIGKAHWEAKYDFPATNRRVHNRIEAVFQFQDGKIIQHRDTFSFWKWSFMALGPIGLILGWSPIIRKKVQQRAFRGLDKFIRSEL